MHLIFCTTFVMALSGENSNGPEGIFFEQGGDEQGDTDSGEGFQESIQLGLFESIYKSVYTKKTEKNIFLSLKGRKLTEETVSSVDGENITLSTRYKDTNIYPVIPNIDLLKGNLERQVKDLDLRVILIPEGTTYQEANVSPLKVTIAAIFTSAVLGTAAAFYKNIISFSKKQV